MDGRVVLVTAKRKGTLGVAPCQNDAQPVVEATLLHYMHMNIARDLQGC